MKNDYFIKKSKWDEKVYEEVIWIIENNILPFVHLLKRTIDAEDYRNNFGIYEELVLSNGGLPEFFNYRQLIDDKNVTSEKIREILGSESVSSKEDMVKKWKKRGNIYWRLFLINSRQ